MNACRSVLQWRLLVDAAIVLLVILLLAVVEFGLIPHRQIGFYCNDPKISFKFTGDTVTMGVLLAGSVVLPLIVMWTAEWTFHKSDSYVTTAACTGSRAKQIWTWFGHYAVGVTAVTLICEIAKMIIGEPRPHFFDTCKPQEMQNCTDQYVSSYTCMNQDEPNWFISDSSKSFPSGHSAISMFTSTFMMWYIQIRMPSGKISLLLKPWLQCMMSVWGVTCSLTRIVDNRHHWWDVLVGVIIGILGSILVVKMSCRGFVVTEGGVSRAFSEPIENGHILDEKRHQSVRKLLSNNSVETPEGRELRDVTATWKE